MWAENEARRANRNLLVLNGAIAAIVILAIAGNLRYCVNFIRGCEPISSAELASLDSADQRWRNFVVVAGDHATKPGYRLVEKTTQYGKVISTEVKAEYVFLQVGEKILLVKAPPGEARLSYSGQLVPTQESVQTGLLNHISAREPQLASQVLPFTLDAVDYRDTGYAFLFAGLPILGLAVWNCMRGLRRSSDLQTTPMWKSLSAFGNVYQLGPQIDLDLRSGARKYGKINIGSRWMTQQKPFTTWVSPVDDLVWVYKKVTKHSVNFIPTGKTYAVVLVGRHKQRTESQMKEQVVNELLADLAQRTPWVIFGFDKNLSNTWQKNPESIIAAVDSRRQQFKPQAAAAAATAAAPPPPVPVR